MHPTQPLAQRLIRTMFPWFLLIALGLVALQAAVQYVSVNDAIDRDLASLCNTVEQPMAEAVWELDRPSLEALSRGILHNATATGLQIVGSEGRILLASGEIPAGQAGDRSWGPRLHKQKTVRLYILSQRGTEQWVGTLAVYSSPRVAWERIRSSLIVSLLSFLVMAFALWYLFPATIRAQLSRSVTGVAAAVASWHSRPVDAPVERIVYPYPDEVGDLVDALNESRARLYESMRHLSALNLDLERLIPVRTADLQEAKERADAADRIKSAFLATISHELRTPLNSIIGFTGILLQGLVWPLNDEEKKQLGMVRDSSTHLLELLGGSIWVESHLGEGSVFASVLPVKGGKS